MTGMLTTLGTAQERDGFPQHQSFAVDFRVSCMFMAINWDPINVRMKSVLGLFQNVVKLST